MANLIGIYDDNNLLKEKIKIINKTSEDLPKIMQELLNKYNFSELAYANGPGSYMSLKIVYVFLSTIALVKNIPLKAISGFTFTKNNLIKANNNLYFTLADDKIKLIKNDNFKDEFFIPNEYNFKFLESNLPNYFLPAI
ncbi:MULTISPECIES: tRNA threonylcarbamoyladenosine biosynthesis protein TsaB [unclassified Campylobacter]|uniref:tRNA threonylcarbamoyladenosine biosynthesis protein TsaB n=1 Tax=unclassified Campylobacter TaxID=2593542 RepID=UPI001BD9D6C0|nr:MULTISPECIES: tRNA threonylcarbamoyladenosine biosynthesis protein TsaB [unclassified Campylobacter]MBT0880616.1 tRNA threonylcarbamoyladenosine biosynthesis protein TsaB [Campylobacter sp. 2018MI27]MBT0882972.1 tRNA threonylcarbamoyladenosine biosynthesis protein TsaB [Campylobacter sp. 2018MI13]MBT0885215.1 tRNA threonylcarbamoyladenosine biosynthesis protein TsaB [Campylobacter sp. 2018MI10]